MEAPQNFMPHRDEYFLKNYFTPSGSDVSAIRAVRHITAVVSSSFGFSVMEKWSFRDVSGFSKNT